MERYNLELLQDGAVAAARSVALESAKALWPKLSEFARRALAPGGYIRVTDAEGGIVIFVGVASARRPSPSATETQSIATDWRRA